MARRVALLRKKVKRRTFGGRKKKDPNDESTERVNVWIGVRSSWIRALRFVPVARGRGPHLVQPKRIVGYVDMRVKYEGREYRYGDGTNIYLLQFKDWRTAASKGIFWWTRWTKMYSPAVRMK